MGWIALAVGLSAALALSAGFLPAVGIRVIRGLDFLPAVSLAASFAGVVVSVFALVGRLRTWPVWAGLVLSALPALFWVYFAVAEVLYPH